MQITYLGLSSFELVGDQTSLITDPFDEKVVGMKYPSVGGDVVTVSHHHPDHDKVENVSGARKIIDGPGEYEIAGVSIFGFPSFHDDKKGSERGKNVIYVIEMDGIKICHLGDLGHTLTDDEINQLGDIDVLFIPVGGVYTIDPKAAKELITAIEPKIAIPMHFNTDKLNKETFADLATLEDFLSINDLKVETEKRLKLKAASLPEEQKIVVLNA